MPYVAIAFFLWVLGTGLVPLEAAAQRPYLQPLKTTGFTARAVVLPPRTIGKTVIRTKHALAVEIRVQIENYLPRGLEPTLFIEEVPVVAASGVIGVEGHVTTLGFLVEKPEILKEGATLALQMGDDVQTRSRVPGVLRREMIRPLDPDETRRWGLPTLDEWLSRPKN
jgi:hypothetical protein